MTDEYGIRDNKFIINVPQTDIQLCAT